MLEPSPCCFARAAAPQRLAGSGRGLAAAGAASNQQWSPGKQQLFSFCFNRQAWRIELECHLNTLA